MGSHSNQRNSSCSLDRTCVCSLYRTSICNLDKLHSWGYSCFTIYPREIVRETIDEGGKLLQEVSWQPKTWKNVTYIIHPNIAYIVCVCVCVKNTYF